MNNTNLRRPWRICESGNLKGRPPLLSSIAELARGEITKHGLVEKLGEIAAGKRHTNIDHQLRAITLLLAYGFGPPRAEIEGSGAGGTAEIVVTYVNRAAVFANGRGLPTADAEEP